MTSQPPISDLSRGLSWEWLETNGRGGFASGTVAGPNTRRYHALLLVARRPPTDRYALVQHLEEWVSGNGERFALSANLYPGAVHPEGFRQLAAFTQDPWPTWTFRAGEVEIVREIVMPHGRDLVVIRWRLTRGNQVTLAVRPMLSGRDYHALHHDNPTLRTSYETRDAWTVWAPYEGVPAVHACSTGTYQHQPDWYRRIQLPVEQARGLDGEEDWWSPGEFTLPLRRGQAAALVLTTDHTPPPPDIERVMNVEAKRRRQLTRGLSVRDPLVTTLWRAADAFLVTRGEGHTVVAGYPWFTDWGRDTFLSLPGLCLITGRVETARALLDTWATHVSDGMLPNRFPDAGEAPEYNTIDASLWFVHAAGRYLEYTGDTASLRPRMWPAMQQILEGYRRGTRFGIRVDQDGLVTGGASGVQLTWMDAKVGDWVVTPRRGKAVEIQALWMRALAVAESLALSFGDIATAGRCRQERLQAAAAFRARFWYDAGGYLYDVVDGEHGDDASLRPNQLFALGLCDDLLEPSQARRMLAVVERELLTPVGLRTLARGDPQYRARYRGGVAERDGAYHQGTVWPFLLGAFVTAWVKAHGATAEARRHVRTLFTGIEAHLAGACLGQVSEIFDGEAPYSPSGCIAQAWSVAELLRALLEDVHQAAPHPPQRARAAQRVRRLMLTGSSQ